MKSTTIVQQQINDLAKTMSFGTVNDLRIIIAAERAVARLQALEQTRDALIFKGGFVLVKTTDTDRFTRDLDATILGVEGSAFSNCCSVSLSLCDIDLAPT